MALIIFFINIIVILKNLGLSFRSKYSFLQELLDDVIF